MKRITHHLVLGSLLTGTIFISPTVFSESLPPTPYKGGFKFEDKSYKPHWFQIDGLAKIDQVMFWGKDKGNDFPSGPNLRAIEVNFSGGFNDHLSYVFETGYTNGRTEINNAYLKYTGFNDHSNVSVGQVGAPFSLENTSSGKWLLFMERSLPVVTFSPDMGLGVQAKWWKDVVTFAVGAVQPKYDARVRGSDPWLTSVRATYSPIHTPERVYHFGASAWYKKMPLSETVISDRTLLRDTDFKAKPEMRRRGQAGSREVSLLDTGRIIGRNQAIFDLEAAGQWGPFHVAGEYVQALVKRSNPEPKLRFKGWHVQTSYTLTGETRDYDFANGTFGRIRPQSPRGAWQISARYSYLDLNNRDRQGGRENNLSFALSWYVNNNVRLIANYVRANIRPGQPRPGQPQTNRNKRHLDIVGMRAQLVW